MDRMGKQLRHRRLKAEISANPFVTDRRLADLFSVSIQTIRLDRASLGIPDARSRIRNVAENAKMAPRSLEDDEVVGELLDCVLNDRAVSLFRASAGMALTRSGMVRGHHLFAQANSLAVSVVDASVAVTGSVQMRFEKPVRVGDDVVAVATMKSRQERKHHIHVEGSVQGARVYVGEFVVIGLSDEENADG